MQDSVSCHIFHLSMLIICTRAEELVHKLVIDMNVRYVVFKFSLVCFTILIIRILYAAKVYDQIEVLSIVLLNWIIINCEVCYIRTHKIIIWRIQLNVKHGVLHVQVCLVARNRIEVLLLLLTSRIINVCGEIFEHDVG